MFYNIFNLDYDDLLRHISYNFEPIVDTNAISQMKCVFFCVFFFFFFCFVFLRYIVSRNSRIIKRDEHCYCFLVSHKLFTVKYTLRAYDIYARNSLLFSYTLSMSARRILYSYWHSKAQANEPRYASKRKRLETTMYIPLACSRF